jgi:hypothetical protein
MDDHDDNIFDNDDALDYILYEDSERDVRERKGGGGCLSVILILITPAWLLTHYIL